MNQSNNYWPSLFYPIVTALSIIFRHTLNVSVTPMFSLLMSAVIATIFFHLININNIQFMYQRIRKNLALFVKVNVLIGIIWVAAFSALKFINPISYCIVWFSVPAICAFIAIYRQEKQLSSLFLGVGLLVVLAVFLSEQLVQHPGLNDLLGLSIVTIGGITFYAYQKKSYLYSQCMGGAPTIVLATRSFGLIGISLIILLIFTSSGTPIMSANWGEQLIVIFILVVGLTFLLPVYLNQKGIEGLGPNKHSTLVVLCPIFTFIIVAAFLKHLPHGVNVFSGVLIIIITLLLLVPHAIKLMRQKPRHSVLVVDPLISPGYLVQRFNEEGYAVVGLKTLAAEMSYFNYRQYPFVKVVESVSAVSGDIKKLDNLTRKKDIKPIVTAFTGLTSTVPYAEQVIFALFKNIANDPSASQFRCDKFAMNDALNKNGIPAIKQCLIAGHLSIDEKIAVATEFLAKLSVNVAVIKPNSGSAATVGVEVVSSRAEVAQYIHNNQKTLFGHGDYLIQEKISGVEYYIDIASYNGKHIISGVGAYDKTTDGGLFEGNWNDNISPFEPSIKALIDYASMVVQMLEIRNGLYHIEIMDTADGPRLIEVNSRISGSHGYLNIMAKFCHGVDQIDAYCSLLNNKELKFKPFQSCNRLYKFKNRKGNFEIFNVTEIENLASLVSFDILKTRESGFDASSRTLLDTVALIHLSAKTQAEIEQDTKVLQELEKSGACFS